MRKMEIKGRTEVMKPVTKPSNSISNPKNVFDKIVVGIAEKRTCLLL